MFTSFSTALSALDAMSTAIDVVGNNLANLNTPGFKDSTTYFRDLVTESLGAGYQPVKRPPVPEAADAQAPIRNSIDNFIQARLAREQLTPSPEADRRTLLRRVALDLTGIPPTPQEADRFLNDRSPDAYEKLVDRLLASPAYAEMRAMRSEA